MCIVRAFRYALLGIYNLARKERTMYEYEGYGFVVSVADDGEDEIIEAVCKHFDTDVETLEEIDDAMYFGTFESVDNIDSAEFAGEEVNTSEGIFIIDMGDASIKGDARERLDKVMEDLGHEDWASGQSYADYKIICQQ